jgi:cysteine desulfurase
MSDPIYLDYNATTPIAPEVAAAMRPHLAELFGNPSSPHPYGVQTREAVDRARAQVAGLLGCDDDEVVFTSGGTESNNWAIKGSAEALCGRGNHVITSAVEHPAVTEVCRYLAAHGFEISTVGVDAHGRVEPAAVEAAIRPETTLVTVMLANNEVGTLNPIAEIAEVTRGRGIRLHTDAAQAVGKVPTRVDELGVDLLSVAGHKLYAPKGIGALYIRRGTELAKFMHGADHEADRRAGTENVLQIAGLGQAAELARLELDQRVRHCRDLRDRLHGLLSAGIPDAHLNGHPEHRLPNTLSISFPGVKANKLLDRLTGVAASAGAACHSSVVTVSHVLEAMAVPERTAMGTVRLSVGRETSEDDIDRAAASIVAEVQWMRGQDD